jgi:ferrous iron transport protein B
MIFALAGNQNCGKTTLFNQLTGSNQHVGNFPGVTVERKDGVIRGHHDVTVVDLPGIYSLSPYTNEEIVTRDFLLNNHPDGIINIVDATNIERNLYLSMQLIELNLPMVIALNMMDEVRANGGTIIIEKFQEELGVPVVPISASKNEGIDELIETAVSTAGAKQLPKRQDFVPVQYIGPSIPLPIWWKITPSGLVCRQGLRRQNWSKGTNRCLIPSAFRKMKRTWWATA